MNRTSVAELGGDGGAAASKALIGLAAAEGLREPEERATTGQGEVVVFRPAHLPGVELWSFRETLRPWTGFNTRYAFGSAERLPDRQEWRYRGCRYNLTLASTMLIEPGELHVTTAATGPVDAHLLFVEPEALEAELAEAGRTPARRHFATGQIDHAGTVAQFQRLWRSLESDGADPLEHGYHLRRYLRMLFEHAGELAPQGLATGCAKAIRRAREVLEEGFARRIRLDDLARETGLSKYHLERSFHERVGLPIHQYLRRVRVARALQMLRAGRRPADVATVVGFSDQPHMTRVFREELGFTPRYYWAAD